ncbi:Homeobox-like_domain superfamily [Hexamita inflata]|uniref:Homeobox-like domain superfamily n=1 Tax=Hexamita inflata TaxID=28002 RepID=A0AA86RWY1_9EUKA|nr:Homeobox-like domain superfamily [Hexamita inflata]
MSKTHNKWTSEEIQTVFQYLPIFGIKFKLYTTVISRPENQIKSFYYNNLQRIRAKEQRNAELQENKQISGFLVELMRSTVSVKQ